MEGRKKGDQGDKILIDCANNYNRISEETSIYLDTFCLLFVSRSLSHLCVSICIYLFSCPYELAVQFLCSLTELLDRQIKFHLGLRHILQP